MKLEDEGPRKYKERIEINKECNSGTKVQQLEDFLPARAHRHNLSHAHGLTFYLPRVKHLHCARARTYTARAHRPFLGLNGPIFWFYPNFHKNQF